MKANEAPEKIYISTNSQDGTYYISNQYKRLIEYIRADAFFKKADEFIGSFIHPDDTELKKSILNEFHKYMEGMYDTKY